MALRELTAVDTWPISVVTGTTHTFIGIPDRLGDGQPYRERDAYPTLEEIAGDDWEATVLSLLLPRTRAWAWSTRSEVYSGTGLSSEAAPPQVDLRAADLAVRRRRLRGMVLVLVPADRTSEQDIVMHWADADTEQIPDFIWTAPDGVDAWDLEGILSWCADSRAWGDSACAIRQPAERIVALFDSQISCVLPGAAAEDVMRSLAALASRWHLRLISGPSEYAWVARHSG